MQTMSMSAIAALAFFQYFFMCLRIPQHCPLADGSRQDEEEKEETYQKCTTLLFRIHRQS
jgi:hypothetical protein